MIAGHPPARVRIRALAMLIAAATIVSVGANVVAASSPTAAAGAPSASAALGALPSAVTVPAPAVAPSATPVPAAGTATANAPTTPSRAPVPASSSGSGGPGVGYAGNGLDYVAASGSTIIGSTVGSFPAIDGLTSETGGYGVPPFEHNACVGGTGNLADCFELQINTNVFWTTSPYTGGDSFQGWEQFLYGNPGGGGSGNVYIEFWLYNYLDVFSSCPAALPDGSTWFNPSMTEDCTVNTIGTPTPNYPITDLGDLTFSAYANYEGSGKDVSQLCYSGPTPPADTCYTDPEPDNVLNLDQYWNQSEFNVVGNEDGSQAVFNTGTSIEVSNVITDASGSAIAPACVVNGTTGETNNLFLGPCGTTSSGIGFAEASQVYSIASLPSSVTALAGTTAKFPLTVTTTGGTPAPVTLSVISGLPSGASASFSSDPVTPTASSTLSIATTTSVTLGDWTLLVQGQFGVFDEYALVYLHLYDFTITFAPPSQTVLRGQSTSYSVTMTLVAGSSTTGIPSELMAESGLPSDASYTWGSSDFIPSFGGTTFSFTVTAHGPPSGSLGDFTFKITATDPEASGGSRSGSAHLHIFDFSVVLTPISRTTLRGTTTVYALTLTLTGGSTTVAIPDMSISVAGGPTDTTYTLSAATMTPTLVGCTSSTLEDCQTVTATTAGPPSGSLGNYTFTVTASDPFGGARSTTPPGQLHIFDFTVSLAPTSVTIPQGGSVTMTVHLGLVPGSTTIGLPSISMSLVGLPSDIVAVGLPATMTIGETATFLLESSSVASYVSCPQVHDGGGQFLPGANLAHCDLAGYDLVGDDLLAANLEEANLGYADLAGANLLDANLASANVEGTDFQGADLQNVDLSAAGPVGLFPVSALGSVDGGSRVSGPTFVLVLGDLMSGDDFQGADLQGADLAWAVLTGYVGDFTNFDFADLDDANLTAATCGSPNNITAGGVQTQGIENVPAACNPPLGSALGVALGSTLGTPAAMGLEGVALAVAALGAIVALASRRRPRRPSHSPGAAGGRRPRPTPGSEGARGRAGAVGSPESVLRRARAAQHRLASRGETDTARKLSEAIRLLEGLVTSGPGPRAPPGPPPAH